MDAQEYRRLLVERLDKSFSASLSMYGTPPELEELPTMAAELAAWSAVWRVIAETPCDDGAA